MINIRYHIFTLVAVFLALAIGLVAGSTVIQQSLVDQLEGNLDRLEQTNSDVEQRNNELDDQLAAWRDQEQALAEQAPALLLSGRLVGTSVLMVGVDGIDERAVGAVRDSLATAGATLPGTIWLRERSGLVDDEAVGDLAGVLGIAASTPAVLHAELAQRLGDLLAVVAAPAVQDEDEGESDGTTTTTRPIVSGETAIAQASRLLALLANLEEVRFVDLDGDLGDARPSDLVGARVVVMGGSGAKVDNGAVLVPLLDRLGRDGQPVAVAVEAPPADPAEPTDSFVGALRSDRRLRDQLSTVDDANLFAGWAATVLAVDDLAAGRVGHYGTGDGAERLLPAPRTP